MTTITRAQSNGLTVDQKKQSFLLTKMRAADLARVSYVARRGVNLERGAVQRLLNRTRITGISEFVLAGGSFPNSIVLNWTNKKHRIKRSAGKLSIPLAPSSAQLIDGQHRVEGIRDALKKDGSFANLEIPVAIYEFLSTRECADIFLSINTEQKPVSRSLVIDLYGVASEYIRDDPVLEAKRLADGLNNEKDSPFFGLVRYPGPKQRGPGIALSSIVGVLKPLVVEKGAFDQVGLLKHEDRLATLLNWFSLLRDAYGNQWQDRENVFRYASGFWGAIEFFAGKLLRHCYLKDAFDKKTMGSAMVDLNSNLIWQRDVAGLQGRKAANTIADILSASFAGRLERKKVKV